MAVNTTKLEGLEVLPPPEAKVRQLVILIHGYGANGADLAPLGEVWSAEMPETAFIAPDGPELVPDTVGGRQWFGFDAESQAEMHQRLVDAAVMIETFIDEQLERFSLSNKELALVGFSQGTMLALEIALRRTPEIAALVGYSGSLPNGERLGDEMVSKPPVLLVHGDADPMIPVKGLFRAVLTLKAHGLMPDWEICHELGHGIDQTGVARGQAFLMENLAIVPPA